MFMKEGLVTLVYLKKDFDLKVEEDVFAFLGIKILKDKKGNAISLRQ